MHAFGRRRLIGLGLAAVVTGATLITARPLALAARDGNGALDGRVLDTDGGPLAHAIVTVTAAELDAGDLSLTTDGDGHFALTPAPAGLYDVRVELAGYRPGIVGGIRVTGGETARAEIVLERRPPGGSGY